MKASSAIGVTATDTFTLTVISSCSIATITPKQPKNQVYNVNTTASLYKLPAFTASDGDCSIVYSLTLLDGSTITGTPVSFTAASREMSTYSLDYT